MSSADGLLLRRHTSVLVAAMRSFATNPASNHPNLGSALEYFRANQSLLPKFKKKQWEQFESLVEAHAQTHGQEGEEPATSAKGKGKGGEPSRVVDENAGAEIQRGKRDAAHAEAERVQHEEAQVEAEPIQHEGAGTKAEAERIRREAWVEANRTQTEVQAQAEHPQIATDETGPIQSRRALQKKEQQRSEVHAKVMAAAERRARLEKARVTQGPDGGNSLPMTPSEEDAGVETDDASRRGNQRLAPKATSARASANELDSPREGGNGSPQATPPRPTKSPAPTASAFRAAFRGNPCNRCSALRLGCADDPNTRMRGCFACTRGEVDCITSVPERGRLAAAWSGRPIPRDQVQFAYEQMAAADPHNDGLSEEAWAIVLECESLLRLVLQSLDSSPARR